MSSPPQNQLYHVSSLPGWSLDSENAPSVSTRGQRLPGLIQSRSSTNLLPRSVLNLRRLGSFHHEAPLAEDEQHDEPVTMSPRRRGHTQAEYDGRRTSLGPEVLMTPQMRSMRLIGHSNPRYQWHQYWKTDEELGQMSKPLKKYYERNNFLVSQYMYIDRLLDSSLPHNLIQEYQRVSPNTYTNPMPTITEGTNSGETTPGGNAANGSPVIAVKRTPKDLYKLPDDTTPLLEDAEQGQKLPDIRYDEEEEADSQSPVVTVAIYVNLVANVILLASKIAVIVLTSSLSVLASLVDAALDFLSTAIVWTTTQLISRQDQYSYPIGRRRLEPVGVLVFSVVMITSFFQVALECIQRLNSEDHSIVSLGIPAIAIMVSTVIIKGFCWLWCRLIKNSSVQALAQDAVTDVVFNTFSIIFPLVGFYAKIWWLDALGGLLLSFFVIIQWSKTSSSHIRNLSGAAATKDQRNVLLYLTMRFAKTIKSIQNIQAYHTSDKLNVEVDIVLDESTSLRDSHDLSESLQYVLESVPYVDRAFVHTDYAKYNLPSHMNQQAS